MEPPRRPYKLTITVSGHNWQEIIDDLNNNVSYTIDRLGVPEENYQSITGGSTCSNSIHIEVDKNPLSFDQYHSHLKEYLEHKREEKK